MADVAITTAAEPDGAPRIAILDILRGVAILGILFMNINDMGQSMYASFDDIRHLGWSASDQVAWWLRAVLADGTARAMLEMLFGAGMVILTDRVAAHAAGWVVLRRYYARNLILFGFGLVHVFVLLWPGDILHTYGLAALIAFAFRRLPARGLIAIGLSMAAMQAFGGVINYVDMRQNAAQIERVVAKQQAHRTLDASDTTALKASQERQVARAKDAAETRRLVAAEDAGRRGTFASWAQTQWRTFLDLERQWLEILFVWEAAATMLIGAGLFKLGVLQGQRSRRWYGVMTVIAYALGGALRIFGAYEQTRFDGLVHLSSATQEVARLTMTLGHIGLIHLLAGTPLGARLLRPFGAAGRTALTIYIAQTLICLWVLYPP
uniref:DUF418 domain-containing protein n=1 Tax=uncultured Sphingomonas sp. TaxID=158754 RepID=UPI0035C953D1